MCRIGTADNIYELYVTKEATLFSEKIEEILVIKISDK